MRTNLARLGLATALMVPSAQPQAVSGQTADVAPRSAFEVEDLRLRRSEASAQNAPDSVELLREFRDELAAAEPFDAATTERALKEFVEKKGVKIGELIHALRVAVTGKPKGPGMFDCLELLGRERCLNRIDRTLSRLRQ